MIDLVDRLRSSIADTDPNNYAISDDRLQEILDARRLDFWQDALMPVVTQVGIGSVEYKVYQSSYRNIEGTVGTVSAYRLYDGNGSAVTGYTFDAIGGRFDFTSNQAGSARYLDGKSYDLNGAIADGWRERASQQSNLYDFKVEGRSYSRSQWFEHCVVMAKSFDLLSTGRGTFNRDTGSIERGDMSC